MVRERTAGAAGEPLRYRGRLRVSGQGGPGLTVELTLGERMLDITAAGELLGRYPLSQVSIERVTGDRFALTLGPESLTFVADDALAFSYEALPLVARHRSGPAAGRIGQMLRSWLGSERPADAPAPGTTAGAPRLAAVVPFPAPPAQTEMPPGPAEFEPHQETPAPVMKPGEAPAPVEPPPVPPEAPRPACHGVRTDGNPCQSTFVGPNGFCFAHDPERSVERREVRRRADEVTRRAKGMGGDLTAVVERLERAVAEVHEGVLDPQQALAMASLVRAMVETIEVGDRPPAPSG